MHIQPERALLSRTMGFDSARSLVGTLGHCSFNQHNQLHDDFGPALVFADGFSIYSLRDWTVPQNVVEDPSSITITDIDSERNVEVRRILIERFGTARYITESGARSPCNYNDLLVLDELCGIFVIFDLQ